MTELTTEKDKLTADIAKLSEEISELTQAIAEIDASVAEARHSCRPAFAISNEYQMNLTLVAKCVFKIQIERGSFHATTTHFR